MLLPGCLCSSWFLFLCILIPYVFENFLQEEVVVVIPAVLLVGFQSG